MIQVTDVAALEGQYEAAGCLNLYHRYFTVKTAFNGRTGFHFLANV